MGGGGIVGGLAARIVIECGSVFLLVAARLVLVAAVFGLALARPTRVVGRQVVALGIARVLVYRVVVVVMKVSAQIAALRRLERALRRVGQRRLRGARGRGAVHFERSPSAILEVVHRPHGALYILHSHKTFVQAQIVPHCILK